jgi:hypothetical protein
VNIAFKATESLLSAIRSDLRRPHAHAYERVGFIAVRAAAGAEDLVLYGTDYHPVADEDYLIDDSVGARIGSDAIRKSLEIALRARIGVFHIHLHDHEGRPGFSKTDLAGQNATVPDFFKVRPQMPHGAIVLSIDHMAGSCWLDKTDRQPIRRFVVVDAFTRILA